MASLSSDLPRIRLAASHWGQMLADVASRYPEEACGLVAGRAGRSMEVIPVTNILRSPVRYRMAPQEQLEAFERIEARGLELLAIYHSHPHGPDHPSNTDIDEAYYPEAVTLIWFPVSSPLDPRSGWDCKAFRIREKSVSELRIDLVEDDTPG